MKKVSIEERNKMVMDNEKLVYRFVNMRYPFLSPLDREDCIQQGFLGLIKAAEKYDHTKGAFSTYAYIWILHFISKRINFDYCFFLKGRKKNEVIRFHRLVDDFFSEKGYYPDHEEIAELTGWDEKKITEIEGIYRKSISISLETPICMEDNEKLTVADTIEAKTNVEDNALENTFYEKFVTDVKESLSDDEFNILKRHFGLEGARTESLSAIAKDYGKSRQWIGLIESKILKKLKRRLKGYEESF